MRAMVLDRPRALLRPVEMPAPRPRSHEVLLQVRACALCRTDLHIIDGELPPRRSPLIPGHQIVGAVIEAGADVRSPAPGQRVGVSWLAWTCGECSYCRAGHENLCDRARFTGYDVDGGFAEYAITDARYCFAIPEGYPDDQAAPLLCGGLIGYRCLRFCDDARRLGIFGFGAAAHIVTQVAAWQQRAVYAFTRQGDEAAQAFARELGAVWAGGSDAAPPEPLDAAIIFAPAGELVPAALRAVRKAGVVVCGGIHMSPIPSFGYDLLWGERVVRSVANLTRSDGEEFLRIAPAVPVRTHVRTFALSEANDAVQTLRSGGAQGAIVLIP